MQCIPLLKYLQRKKIYLLWMLDGVFRNPLNPEELKLFEAAGGLASHVDDQVLQAFERHADELPSGMYFPVLIQRNHGQEEALTVEMLKKYHYDLIRVDQAQQWFFKGEPVRGKIKTLFEENLHYDEHLQLYFVQYQVDARLDKCYLDCEIPPLNIVRILPTLDAFETAETHLGHLVSLEPREVSMDAQERLFLKTTELGWLNTTDSLRFDLMMKLNEAGTDLVLESGLIGLSRIQLDLEK